MGGEATRKSGCRETASPSSAQTRINRSREAWFLVSGDDKAEAAAQALTGSAPLPAAQVEAVERTVWLADTAAASLLPDGVVRSAD